LGGVYSAQSVGRADIERQEGSLAKFNRRGRGAARNQVKIPDFRGSRISREEILAHAYAQCRSNKGVPGADVKPAPWLALLFLDKISVSGLDPLGIGPAVPRTTRLAMTT
jgi:hypothetical protein